VTSELAARILEDCRRAVGEVRFGFGSKRQVWAFEERHEMDVCSLVDQLAGESPAGLLELAVAFHDEFAAVSNSWRVRDRIQHAVAELCRWADGELLEGVAAALVDGHLAVRHWLVAALAAAPALVAFRQLEDALPRAYRPKDQWALLGRLETLAEANGWAFGPAASRVLAGLAQYSFRPEERLRAVELLARFGGPQAQACLDRAAKGDGDASVRGRSAELLSASLREPAAQPGPPGRDG
jgi:hypothetical protein